MQRWMETIYKSYSYKCDLNGMFVDSLWRGEDINPIVTFAGMHLDSYETKLSLENYIMFKSFGHSDVKIAMFIWPNHHG